MDWDPSVVRVASYKDVEFPCVLATGTKRSKRYRSIEYPNRPGGQIWDGGRRPVTIDMTALFGVERITGLDSPALGDTWRIQLRALIEACNEIGPGTLVHPIYGEIWALCTDYPDDLRGNAPNQATMRLSFIEAAQGANAWDDVTQIASPEARAETLSETMDTNLGYSGEDSFGYHVSIFISLLATPTLTVAAMEAQLAETTQAILSLADAIDTDTYPLFYDYVTSSHTLVRLLIEAADLQVGRAATLTTYLVNREMTLMDVAAECGCSESEVLQYNSIPDPLSIPAGQYLIVPA